MAKKRATGKYACRCGYSSESYQAWYQHVRRKNEMEPGQHGKVEMVVSATLAPNEPVSPADAFTEPVPPGDFTEPVIATQPCPDCEVAPAAESCPDCVIAQRNLERRAELEAEHEAYLASCPGCGVVAALSLEEADVLGRVHARFEQASPPAEGAGDASVKAELPGPAVSLDDDKPNRTGIYIVVSVLALVGFVVLVILKVRGVIPG